MMEQIGEKNCLNQNLTGDIYENVGKLEKNSSLNQNLDWKHGDFFEKSSSLNREIWTNEPTR